MQLAIFDFDVRYRSGYHNASADVLSRQPLAGENEPEVAGEGEDDDFVAICNVICRDTDLGPDELQEVVKCFSIRHIWVRDKGGGGRSVPLGNTPTLPGYTREELRGFQDANPTLGVLRKFWDVKRKPTVMERQGMSRYPPCHC